MMTNLGVGRLRLVFLASVSVIGSAACGSAEGVGQLAESGALESPHGSRSFGLAAVAVDPTRRDPVVCAEATFFDFYVHRLSCAGATAFFSADRSERVVRAFLRAPEGGAATAVGLDESGFPIRPPLPGDVLAGDTPGATSGDRPCVAIDTNPNDGPVTSAPTCENGQRRFSGYRAFLEVPR